MMTSAGDEREKAADWMDAHVVPSTYVTADVPGIGGRLKERPEDFLVEEIPAYQPSGKGEHIYLMVQKSGLATTQMIQIVAKHFRVKTSNVGYAGLKDKHAITRQVISVHAPGKRPEQFPELRHPRIAVLWADLHDNKLRRGHLKGNRFSIRVRGVSATGVLLAKQTLERLEKTGVPNRLGEQRFGTALNNHLIGRALILGDDAGAIRELLASERDTRPQHARQRECFLSGDYAQALALLPEAALTERAVLRVLVKGGNERAAVHAMGDLARQFFVSSFQSAVFNGVLDRRLEDARAGRGPGLDALREGDWACKHENGAVFRVDGDVMRDPATKERLARLEISPTGPMWGPRMPRAEGASGAAETEQLGVAGVSEADIGAFAVRVRDETFGERRPLRVALSNVQYEGGVDEFGPYVRCAFDLPAGAFATVAMREVMKPERAAGGGDEGEGQGGGDADGSGDEA